jgi:hypothetical protein
VDFECLLCLFLELSSFIAFTDGLRAGWGEVEGFVIAPDLAPDLPVAQEVAEIDVEQMIVGL